MRAIIRGRLRLSGSFAQIFIYYSFLYTTIYFFNVTLYPLDLPNIPNILRLIFLESRRHLLIHLQYGSMTFPVFVFLVQPTHMILCNLLSSNGLFSENDETTETTEKKDKND